MHTMCINTTSGRKYLTENGFSDSAFLYTRHEHFACKPMFKGTLNKLVNKRKLSYARACQSLLVVSPKKFVFFLGKVNLPVCSKFDKNRTRNVSLTSCSAMADRPCDCLHLKSSLCSCWHCQWISAGPAKHQRRRSYSPCKKNKDRLTRLAQ